MAMHQAARSAKAGLRALAGFVWPARSILTGERHGGQGAVSPEDFAKLHFLNGAGCRACAAALTVDLGETSLCAACIARPPKWDQARAALAYTDASRQAVLELKYAGRRDGLTTMTNWMALAGRDILTDTDRLVPVPLHYQRLARRGFNQAGWLAQGIGQHAGIPVLVDAIVRTRATPSQSGLSPRQRYKNVAGAFKVRRSRRKQIGGATITLVDDVYTTGSTLKACTRALLQAGAASVNVLVLARVVRETDVTL